MSTFVYTSTMYTYHSSRIHEAVMLSLISVLNRSDYAQLLPNSLISKFFATYTSVSHSFFRPKPSFDTYPSFTVCGRNALILMFRSWPGIFHFIHDGLSSLQTLLYTLAVGSTETRNQILDLLYGLFPTIPIPHPSVKDLEPTVLGLIEALSTGAPSLLPVLNITNSGGKTNNLTADIRSSVSSSAWDIEGGFIPAEGCRLFTKYALVGFDLMNNYNALLLATLIQAGLYEALVRAISDSNQVTSTRAGYLLGSLAHKVGSLLSQEHPICKRLHQAGLLCPETSGSQLAVLWLERIHRVMKLHETHLRDPSSLIRVPLHSPFLECLAKQSVDFSSSTQHPVVTDQIELTDATLDQLIALSNVLSFKSKSQHGRFSQCQLTTCNTKPPDVWNWDVLTALGRYLSVTRVTFSWESKLRMKFLRSLMEFFTPDQMCRTDPIDPADKYTPISSTGRSSSIPNKPILPDGLISVDGLLNVINSNRNVVLQNLDPKNLKDVDSFLYSQENKSYNYNASRINYLINSNANFNLAWLSHNWPHASAAGILIAGLISHLAYYSPTSEPSQFLDRFLTVLHLCLKFALSKISNETLVSHDNLKNGKGIHDSNVANQTGNSKNIDSGNSNVIDDVNNANLILLFNSSYLHKSCGSLILLAASRLTNSQVGELRLEKAIYALISKNHISQKHFFHCILALRIYTIRLIRLLFRLKLPFLASWCVDLVVKLCMDSSSKVRQLALCLLEELCWDPVNVQALSQNILQGQTNDTNVDQKKSVLTPFAIHLLHLNTGPIGHRIFAKVLSVTNVFDKLCLNKSSSFRGCSCKTLEHNKNNTSNCAHSRTAQDFVNKSCGDKSDNNINGVTSSVDICGNDDDANDVNTILHDPINWMLDIAVKYYNLAYAKDMDTRLTSMFVTYETRLPNLSYQSGNFPSIDLLGSVKAVHSNSNTNDESENDDDDEDLESIGRPSNVEFSFEDNYFVEATDVPGTYLPPPLITDKSLFQICNGQDSFHCLPLPKHPYACIAEHHNGLDLLDKRMDLEIAVANIRSFESRLHTTQHNTLDETGVEASGTSALDTNLLIKLKADMWALAHTCSTSCGQSWLSKHPELIKLLTNLAFCSDTMSVRAIAWICLNLIASCPNGYLRNHNHSEAPDHSQLSNRKHYELDEATTSWLFIPQIYDEGDDNNNYSKILNTTQLASHRTTESSLQVSNQKVGRNANKSTGLSTDIPVVIPPAQPATENKIDKHPVNEQKSFKTSVRSQVFENLSRSRRWLHRRWSPSHRRFSPPTCELGQHSSFYVPTSHQHNPSDIKDNHSSTSSSQISSFNCDVQRVNILSSKQPYSTWTHRDCILHRQAVLTSNQTIYLPIDIRVLGYKKNNNTTNYRYPINVNKFTQLLSFGDQSTTRRHFEDPHCSLASCSGQNLSKNYKSFIDVAADAQMMLSAFFHRKFSALSSIPDEISVDSSNPDVGEVLINNNGSSDNENRLYSSDIQITDHSNNASSHEESPTSREYSLKLDEGKQISEKPTIPSGDNYLANKDPNTSLSTNPVEKLDAINSWFTTSEMNEVNLQENKNTHKPHVVKLLSDDCVVPSNNNMDDAKHTGIKKLQLHPSVCHKHKATNHNEDDKSAEISSNSVYTNKCLSLSCSSSIQNNNGPLTDQELWYNELSDSICSLLPNVISSPYDSTLDRLLKKAIITQQNSKDSVQLFSACTYTLIADLLGSYTFSRQARTKIQSFFLYFRLDELMEDAKNSLIQLEKHLTAHFGSIT
ncbi:unnamed protein product [Heterobilharzia americana]|nr:unnamed protein product [Heterobilharzia americana]